MASDRTAVVINEIGDVELALVLRRAAVVVAGAAARRIRRACEVQVLSDTRTSLASLTVSFGEDQIGGTPCCMTVAVCVGVAGSRHQTWGECCDFAFGGYVSASAQGCQGLIMGMSAKPSASNGQPVKENGSLLHTRMSACDAGVDACFEADTIGEPHSKNRRRRSPRCCQPPGCSRSCLQPGSRHHCRDHSTSFRLQGPKI